MNRTLELFLKALRHSDLKISIPETLDAYRTVETVGIENRSMLRDALATCLAKSREETERFDETFDRFFALESQGSAVESWGATDEVRPGTAAGMSNESGEIGDGGELVQSALGQMIVADDTLGFQADLQRAAREMELDRMWLFTQKGVFTYRMLTAMGLRDLDADILRATQGDEALADTLRTGRQKMLETTREFVESQFDLFARNAGSKLHDQFLEKMRLSEITRRDQDRMRNIIKRMAKRLASLHARRIRRTRRGLLDVRRTMRRNHTTGGIPFELVWRRKHINKPRIVALCDVSGSVASVSQFLLMFLYSLNEVVSDVHAYAFCSDLVEVTDLFQTCSLEDAASGVLDRVRLGSTDYGRAFEDFERVALDRVDHRTTVVVLGDARSNYLDARADLLDLIRNRARQVIWMNPEGRTLWGTGDSEMRRYEAYVDIARTTNTLKHLERVIDDLLKRAV